MAICRISEPIVQASARGRGRRLSVVKNQGLVSLKDFPGAFGLVYTLAAGTSFRILHGFLHLLL